MLVLAAEDTTGWVVGIALGVVVVLVVVVLLVTLITAASRIHAEAEQAIDTLQTIRGSTASLHGVDQLNNSAVGILQGAQAARETLK
jgi:hypothetical protein